jgi:hypothetical protein
LKGLRQSLVNFPGSVYSYPLFPIQGGRLIISI